VLQAGAPKDTSVLKAGASKNASVLHEAPNQDPK